MSPLHALFLRHHCDKALHLYHQFYQTLPAPVAMLECGVFRGASLRAWRELWPHARIVGVDTFERSSSLIRNSAFPALDVELVTADCRHANLARHSLLDLIIDDASHAPADQAATLLNLWPLLESRGAYVIEDVVLYDRPLTPWFQARAASFNANHFNSLLSAVARCNAHLTIHDYRDESQRPDSVLFVLRRP